ncbi:MAG: hypothetical protein N2690_04865 [Rhodocyclaceae bacterium]|nr:hypothetical protein [Rhodocyclaceae bacterium]
MDYISFLFDLLETMLASIETVATTISGAVIGLLRDSQIVYVAFAIQVSLLVISFILDNDGISAVVGFIRLCLIYGVIVLLLGGSEQRARWTELSTSFVQFGNRVLTGGVAAASSCLSGSAVTIQASLNPAEALSSMYTAFRDKMQSIEDEYNAHQNALMEKIRARNQSSGQSELPEAQLGHSS